MGSLINQLIAFKVWGDERILTACEQLAAGTDSETFEFACQQLNHLVIVEELFKARLIEANEPHNDTNTCQVPDLANLRARKQAFNTWLVEYAKSLSQEALAAVVTFRFVDGQPGRMSRQEILMHLVTHGSYHRSAIGHALERAGYHRPPDTFSMFLHQAEPARRI